MEQAFFCIDDVSAFTHDGFDDHMDQLEGVLQISRDINTQDYVEETFLVSAHFD